MRLPAVSDQSLPKLPEANFPVPEAAGQIPWTRSQEFLDELPCDLALPEVLQWQVNEYVKMCLVKWVY